MTNTKSDFINEKELLKRVPVCRKTWYNYIQTGKIPVVRIARIKLYHWPSVEQALIKLQERQDA